MGHEEHVTQGPKRKLSGRKARVLKFDEEVSEEAKFERDKGENPRARKKRMVPRFARESEGSEPCYDVLSCTCTKRARIAGHRLAECKG
jgi:hypothetical protein